MPTKTDSYLKHQIINPYLITIFINAGNLSVGKPPANARIVAQNAQQVGNVIAVQSSTAEDWFALNAKKNAHKNGLAPLVAQQFVKYGKIRMLVGIPCAA